MSNQFVGKPVNLSFAAWINAPGIHKGILSVYADELFDYNDNRHSYEIGRQIAILAKTAGLKTKGSLIRKKPNSNTYAIVKTKYPVLVDIILNKLMLDQKKLIIEVY